MAGVVHLVVLVRLLRVMTKKGRQLFEGKSAPLKKILATPMLLTESHILSGTL